MYKKTSVRRKGQRLSAEEKRIAQDAFIKAFSNTANVRAACKVAGVDRNTIYSWAEHDETFSLRYTQAELDASDMVRAELWRRAMQGVEEPVTSAGKLVRGDDGKPLMVRKYSDGLLQLLARARMPEFRDKTSVDLRANVDANVTTQQAGTVTIDTRNLSNEELADLKRIALAMKSRQEQ